MFAKQKYLHKELVKKCIYFLQKSTFVQNASLKRSARQNISHRNRHLIIKKYT